jgi:hypothetical protein
VALVNTVLNRPFPYNADSCLHTVAERLLDSEGLCCLELYDIHLFSAADSSSSVLVSAAYVETLLLGVSCVTFICSVPQIADKVFWFQQPTWRLWGEERVDGGIYTVYLKKVRYHRPTKSVSSVSCL